MEDFNPRSPHGERQSQDRIHRVGQRFQPTLPARGATATMYNFDPSIFISTHAPRTGSDPVSAQHGQPQTKFQPTLPARGATAGDAQISTHAPRTGSDRNQRE